MVGQGGGVMVLGEARQPVMDADPADAEQPRDFSDRLAGGDFEDGKGSAKKAGVGGGLALGLQPVAPSGRQVEFAHRNTSTASVVLSEVTVKFQLSTRLGLLVARSKAKPHDRNQPRTSLAPTRPGAVPIAP